MNTTLSKPKLWTYTEVASGFGLDVETTRGRALIADLVKLHNIEPLVMKKRDRLLGIEDLEILAKALNRPADAFR